MADTYRIGPRWNHAKASEVHLEISVDHGDGTCSHWTVPIVYPRLGLDLKTDEEIAAHIAEIIPALHPQSHREWRTAQAPFWQNKN